MSHHLSTQCAVGAYPVSSRKLSSSRSVTCESSPLNRYCFVLSPFKNPADPWSCTVTSRTKRPHFAHRFVHGSRHPWDPLGSCTCPHILGLSRWSHGGDRGRSRALVPKAAQENMQVFVLRIRATRNRVYGARMTGHTVSQVGLHHWRVRGRRSFVLQALSARLCLRVP